MAFQSRIPGWLKNNGLPDGTTHGLETEEDEKDHAKFKTRKLRKTRLVVGHSNTPTETRRQTLSPTPR